MTRGYDATVVLVVRFPEMSLRGPRLLRRTAQWIKAEIERGARPVIVVATRSRREERGFVITGVGATSGFAGAREIDRARAAAEDLATSMLALALSALGVDARSLSPADLELEGTGEFGAAALDRFDAAPVGRLLASHATPVLSGGHARRRDGEIVMLARGGADLTAVTLAAALGKVPCHFLVDQAARPGATSRPVRIEAVERAHALGVRIATRGELGPTVPSESDGPETDPTTSTLDELL